MVTWLQQPPLVVRVLYPALETDPGHSLWKRDFHSANGLFSVVFTSDVTQEQAGIFAESLELFGLGASWGGYESLVMVYPVVPGWSGNALARLHIGLEEPKDLIADIAQALAKMVA